MHAACIILNLPAVKPPQLDCSLPHDRRLRNTTPSCGGFFQAKFILQIVQFGTGGPLVDSGFRFKLHFVNT